MKVANHSDLFEGLNSHQQLVSKYGRTLTKQDNIKYTLMTQNTNPIHFDDVYAEQTEFKETLVDSTFTLGLTVGQATALFKKVMHLKHINEIKLPSPVFEGDTLHTVLQVIAPIQLEKANGVHVLLKGINQRKQTVMELDCIFVEG